MELIKPDWLAPGNVKAAITTRKGGCSEAPYDALNLALHVDDDASSVLQNRRLLAQELGVDESKICWLKQVHGTRVVTASHFSLDTEADAVISTTPQRVCVVMTADCLPILLCNMAGTQVAAVHAGWRSLASGIVEECLKRFDSHDQIIAYLGPAISQRHFEVGAEVRQQFVDRHPDMSSAFNPGSRVQKYHGDLYSMARIELTANGVKEVYGGQYCTYADRDRFYSYRRDGVRSGRMASLIWLSD